MNVLSICMYLSLTYASSLAYRSLSAQSATHGSHTHLKGVAVTPSSTGPDASCLKTPMAVSTCACHQDHSVRMHTRRMSNRCQLCYRLKPSLHGKPSLWTDCGMQTEACRTTINQCSTACLTPGRASVPSRGCLHMQCNPPCSIWLLASDGPHPQ